MIDRPYCKQHYTECVCSRCKYDMDNCCGRLFFSTYLCPCPSCSEFREKEPEPPKEPEKGNRP